MEWHLFHHSSTPAKPRETRSGGATLDPGHGLTLGLFSRLFGAPPMSRRVLFDIALVIFRKNQNWKSWLRSTPEYISRGRKKIFSGVNVISIEREFQFWWGIYNENSQQKLEIILIIFWKLQFLDSGLEWAKKINVNKFRKKTFSFENLSS